MTTRPRARGARTTARGRHTSSKNARAVDDARVFMFLITDMINYISSRNVRADANARIRQYECHSLTVSRVCVSGGIHTTSVVFRRVDPIPFKKSITAMTFRMGAFAVLGTRRSRRIGFQSDD